MLRAVSLAQQWERTRAGLPSSWSRARLVLRLEPGAEVGRAAELLGPLTPGRVGGEFRLDIVRQGPGPSAGALARTLDRLDEEKLRGALELLATDERAEAEREGPARVSLAADWDALLETLPPDWTDLYAELLLSSSDHLDPAALALAPVNPARYGDELGFRFRCARTFGYGASPGMARRCLARLDERGLPGEIRILRVLAETKPVGTQGPVWYVAGKAV